ncbi:hypothetical protein JIN85_17780 [Luteolibacter pohnpeiensis]|uniref:Uncharacterized protein n=1 Tax=Luteolibacter pohnpeiensis TaxID=454153 RepID=A0A934SE89_9BACT|nr:hypothetical protein [Luteolibacter pohnpeiensis]MBK1884274.1 hypothetical protein [Luteolibacter pohnpeiensis]
MNWCSVFPIYHPDLLPTTNSAHPSICKKILSTGKIKRHLVATTFTKSKYDSIDSLILIANQVQSKAKDITFRIYVGEDQECEISDFVDLGCEVAIMQSSEDHVLEEQIWPFFALEEDRLVTITHASRGELVLTDIERTESVAQAGLGGWRIPTNLSASENQIGYRPIDHRCFGSCRPIPIRHLLNSFIKDCKSGRFKPICQPPWGGELEIANSKWPETGFASWFLMAAVYPRMAAAGLISIIPHDAGKTMPFLPLDIEYCTWANSDAELILCEPAPTPPRVPKASNPKPWDDAEVGPFLHIRPNARVFRRERKKMGPMQKIYESLPHPEVLTFEEFQGDFRSWLLHCSQIKEGPEWWIDFNPILQPGKNGGDLFLDRCYDDADVVVCGSFLMRITDEMAAWARQYGIDDWNSDMILRVPKIEGPLTLWQADFGKNLLFEWDKSPAGIRLELLLKAKMQLNQAKVYETTAGRMGWSVR